MTRFTISAVAALLASTSLVTAGGVERNAFTTAILFEEGTYAEIGYTYVDPDVSGQANPGFPGTPESGDLTESFGYATLSYHQDIDDQWSISVVVDEPIGADVAYPGPPVTAGGYPFALSTAELNSQQITVAARYEINDTYSVFGGIRAAQTDGEIFVTTPTFNYALEADSDTGFGYMLGAAYEMPEIALRVSLTYFSEIDLSLSGSEGVAAGPAAVAPATPINSDFDVTLPQSLLLEAQSGVAEDTLVFGSVRWVDWTEFEIIPGNYPTATGAVVSYENDTWTYTLGVARRLSEELAVLGALSYENEQGGFSSNLGPTDGRIGLSLGGRYTLDQWEFSGGLNYTWIGNADTNLGAPLTSTFTDNTAVGASLRVGYRF